MVRRIRLSPDPGRFRIPLSFAAVALAAFFLLRLALLLRSVGEIGPEPVSILASFAAGLVFDLVTIGWFMAPFVLYLTLLPRPWYRSRANRTLTWLIYFAALYGLYLVCIAEWLFWDEFDARFNFIAVDYLVYRHEVTDNIEQSYPVREILAAVAVAAITTLIAVRRIIARALDTGTAVRGNLAIALGLLAVPAVGLAAVDQSWRDISNNTYLDELAGNGIYQFFHAFHANVLDYRTFYVTRSDDDVFRVLRERLAEPAGRFVTATALDVDRNIDNPNPTRLLNVILVTIESLSADYLGTFGDRRGLTPRLDSIAANGLLFSNVYATGTRTVRGLEALSLSIPPTPGRALLKRPGHERLFTTGAVFRAQGYRTAFLYGGFGYFDNMNAFFTDNGYEVIDRTDFGDDEITFTNAWGVADEDLYRKAIRTADDSARTDRPFFLHLMTTSNHRPFTYPERRIDIPSGTGREGAVKYADWAIGDFLDRARTHAWFANTVFVFVADHCAHSAGKTDLPVARYHVPLIFYAPAHLNPGRIDRVASQIDVAPTLFALLGFDYRSRFFGRDILSMTMADQRALIATYQRLGLFDGVRLAYLDSDGSATVVDDPLGHPTPHPPAPGDPLVDAGIAYYQGADFVIRNGLIRHP